MRRIQNGAPARRLLLTVGLVGAVAACNSLLEVTNPATFGDASLDDPVLGPQMVNGVLARFQAMYDDLALQSAYITDEAVSGHNFPTTRNVDLRILTKENSGDVYTPIARTRALADSFEARYIRVIGDSATRSLGLARIQAYNSLTHTLMGEFLCEAPVDPTQDAVSPDSLFRRAITRGLAAIQTGTAFNAANATAAARGDSLINLARVSVARAYLDLGDKAQAAAIAAQVPAGFEMRSFYDDNNVLNIFQEATNGTNRYLGVDVTFRGLNDPRVRHSATGVTGHDQTTVLFTPSQAESFGGWSPTAAAVYVRSTNVRISSGLEAQYIRAEAEGNTPANVTFVNSRQAVGGQAALVAPTDAQYLAALQDQRRRDFFLDGHRLGDLRRYIRLYNQDFFPTGPHPNQIRGGNYGTDVCFVPTQAEIIGNPGYVP